MAKENEGHYNDFHLAFGGKQCLQFLLFRYFFLLQKLIIRDLTGFDLPRVRPTRKMSLEQAELVQVGRQSELLGPLAYQVALTGMWRT